MVWWLVVTRIRRRSRGNFRRSLSGWEATDSSWGAQFVCTRNRRLRAVHLNTEVALRYRRGRVCWAIALSVCALALKCHASGQRAAAQRVEARSSASARPTRDCCAHGTARVWCWWLEAGACPRCGAHLLYTNDRYSIIQRLFARAPLLWQAQSNHERAVNHLAA